jgi:hypothetical protein
MGEANTNPRSSQYAGNEPDVEPFPLVRLDSRLEPTKEFLARQAEAKARGEDLQPTKLDCNLGIFLIVEVVYPSRLVHSSKWPRESVAVSRICAPSWAQIRKDTDALREASTKPESNLEIAKGQK